LKRSQSELAKLLYEKVYIFNILELEKRIKMTHIYIWTKIESWTSPELINGRDSKSNMGLERTAWELEIPMVHI
jgi:hypothetical protein